MTTPYKDQNRRRRKPRSKSNYPAPQFSADPALFPIINQKIAEATFIVFDIETTGGNPERNGITEIFAIKYQSGKILETFSSLVNPKIPIPPIVVKMTGITNALVKDAPTIDQVMPGFVSFIGEHTLVSHNTIGDLKFLQYFTHQTCGHHLNNFFLCTHLLVEKLVPEAPNKSLTGLGDFFKIAKGKMHRAKEDAELTLQLFLKLNERLQQQDRPLISDAIRLQGDLESAQRIGWAVPVEQLQNLPHGNGVFTLFDKQNKALFKSSCMHLGRELKQFQSWNLLPKPMMKVASQTYSLKVERAANPFEAMLKEHEPPLGRYHHSLHWHHRYLNYLTFTVESATGDGSSHPKDSSPSQHGEMLRIDLGQVRAHAIDAIGPLPDLKYYQNALKQAAEILRCEQHGKHFAFPRVYGDLLYSFFTRRMDAYIATLKKSRYNLKYLVSSKERALIKQLTEAAQDLSKIPLHHMLFPISQYNGLFIAPGERSAPGLKTPGEHGTAGHKSTNVQNATDQNTTEQNARSDRLRHSPRHWQIYSVIHGHPVHQTNMEGDWRKLLFEDGQLQIHEQQMIKYYQQHVGSKSVNKGGFLQLLSGSATSGSGAQMFLTGKPLSSHQADKVNATVWWLYNQRYKSFGHYLHFDTQTKKFEKRQKAKHAGFEAAAANKTHNEGERSLQEAPLVNSHHDHNTIGSGRDSSQYGQNRDSQNSQRSTHGREGRQRYRSHRNDGPPSGNE